MLAFRLLVLDLCQGCREIAVEAEAVVEIVVAPLPLRAGYLHCQVRRARIFHRQYGPRRRSPCLRSVALPASLEHVDDPRAFPRFPSAPRALVATRARRRSVLRREGPRRTARPDPRTAA